MIPDFIKLLGICAISNISYLFSSKNSSFSTYTCHYIKMFLSIMVQSYYSLTSKDGLLTKIYIFFYFKYTSCFPLSIFFLLNHLKKLT
jgi:hypothetical protein